ncbi:hypothetical protein LV716_13915 [Flagellimonas sp. HMM57]|uniref:galactokinase family protein n=1 Tax=unclassified Flagellimonas TaxID=2644544 RepID=UPI0013D8145D|nr:MULTISPECIES: galactokinase family protein [unclassified Flagellimonas]UII75343.1 hypothetical protein LV716_13915 [Flagellimonas sp. HMM57]
MEKTSYVSICSPGRINLIGEHIDYNNGFVLPAAIDKSIRMDFKINGDKSRCTIKSKGFDNILVADLYNLNLGTKGWHNYALDVLHEIQLLGKSLKRFDSEMESNVPAGSGVSCSAALECGLAFGLNELFDLRLSEWEFSKDEPDILGSRMIGGGFGGCTLNLIHKDAIDAFIERASKAYKNKFGIELSYFETIPSQGTHVTSQYI